MGNTIWGLFYIRAGNAARAWDDRAAGGARGGKARLGFHGTRLRSKPTNPRRLAVWGLFYV